MKTSAETLILQRRKAMLNNATLTQLRTMRLSAMASAFQEQDNNPEISSLSFDERIGLAVDAEWLSRKNHRINRLVTAARFRFPASVEDIDYTSRSGITRSDIAALTTGIYIKKFQNVLLSGPTGVGKTYLACALGRAACLQGTAVLYLRISDLFDRLDEARMKNSYSKYRKRLCQAPLLILDDWGLKKFTLDESQEIMELVERRYGQGSMIISGQIPPAAWHDLFPDPTLADAVLDRLVHNAYRYNITGESMRKALAEKDFE
jgi:DNA replication protein DnaC